MYGNYADSVAQSDVMDIEVGGGTSPAVRARKTRRTIALGVAGVAVLSAFIPMVTQAAPTKNLYISGGGACFGSSTAAPGGRYASPGSYNLISGGAYVGEGTNPIVGFDQNGRVDFTGPVPGTAVAGNGVSGNNGANGGSASLVATDLTDYLGIYLEGGGGAHQYLGGNAALSASGLVEVETFDAQSGVAIDPTGTNIGGAVIVDVGILRGIFDTPAQYSFIRRDGSMSVSIGLLEARFGDVDFIAQGTAANDIVIDYLNLGQGYTFDRTGGTGDFTANGYAAYDRAYWKGNFDAANKSIDFYLPADPTVDPVLTVTGANSIDVTGATVRVYPTGPMPTLSVGDVITLIDSSGTGLTGVPATTTFSYAGYQYAISVSDGNLIATVTALPTGMEFLISAAPNLSFGTVRPGYIQPAARTVTVTNIGTEHVTLVQPTATNYVIGALSNISLSPGESATFTVRPKPGLPIGVYNETIEISTVEGGSASIQVSFAVSVSGGTDVPPTGDGLTLMGVVSLMGVFALGVLGSSLVLRRRLR